MLISYLKFAHSVLLLHGHEDNDSNSTNSKNNYSCHFLLAYKMLHCPLEALYAVLIPHNKYEKNNFTKFK